MDNCRISTATLWYYLAGDRSKPLVVVEQMLAGCCAEWWHLADAWSEDYCVLVYDRAGYGQSSVSNLARSPENIAVEQRGLLTGLGFHGPAILVGHSMGGLHAQQYTRMFPQSVCGLILLDPVSAKNYIFREWMSRREFVSCGFDKRRTFKMGLAATRLGLGFLLKPILKHGPPFNYFDGLSTEAEAYILEHLTRAATYRTALDEYAYIDPDRKLPQLEDAGAFPQIPLRLICHAPEVVTAEIEMFGHVDHVTAARLEHMWMSAMKEYLEFSRLATYTQSRTSGHHIHLGDPDLIRQALNSLV